LVYSHKLFRLLLEFLANNTQTVVALSLKALVFED